MRTYCFIVLQKLELHLSFDQIFLFQNLKVHLKLLLNPYPLL